MKYIPWLWLGLAALCNLIALWFFIEGICGAVIFPVLAFGALVFAKITFIFEKEQVRAYVIGWGGRT